MGKSAKQIRLKCNKFPCKRGRDNLPRLKQNKITSYFNSATDNQHTLELLHNNDNAEFLKSNIHFLQINNQKRIMSTESTSRIASNLNSFCVLGSEPSTVGFNITGLNKTHKIIQAAIDKPRAYIYCHKNLEIWPVEELTTRDTAACVINSQHGKKILALSIYWDGRIKTIPKEVELAMEMARTEGYMLVSGGDLNARNTLYGSKETDKRGKAIQDLSVQYDIAFAPNHQRSVTCVASSPGSVMDP